MKLFPRKLILSEMRLDLARSGADLTGFMNICLVFFIVDTKKGIK